MTMDSDYPVFADQYNAALHLGPEGTIFGASRSADLLFGYERSELIGKNIDVLLPPLERARMNRLLERVADDLSGPGFMETGGIAWRGKDGKPLRLNCSLLVLQHKFDDFFVLLFSNPPAHDGKTGMGSDGSYHDPITGLPNHHLFNDRLSQSVTHSERHKEVLALMILDLRIFDGIHPPLTSLSRDRVLRETARKICACVRADDTVCRLRNEKFAVIFPQIREESATYLAQKILRAFESPFSVEGNRLEFSPAMGIAIYPNDGRSPRSLLEKAELALSQARKENKSNFGFYNVQLHAKAIHRKNLETALRTAIGKNELRVYFQPKLKLGEMQICGLEALVRWDRPGVGLVCPGEFIPVAEDTGLILDIGRWVLRQSCLENKKRREEGGRPIPISVNLSMKQFKDRNLGDMVLETLMETGVPPQLLELEVTESVVMEDAGITIETMKRLNEIGVRTGMDDFGTGYSSLSYIGKLPLQFLKIDQSFIKNACQPTGRSIIRAIVDMAKTLQLETVIEGIETRQQLEICMNLGCDQVQGFFVGRPVPAHELNGLLEADFSSATLNNAFVSSAKI